MSAIDDAVARINLLETQVAQDATLIDNLKTTLESERKQRQALEAKVKQKSKIEKRWHAWIMESLRRESPASIGDLDIPSSRIAYSVG